MKIKFERSGGFANIPVNVTLDTAKVAADIGTKTEELVKKLLPFPKEQVEVKAGADMHTYKLTVSDDDLDQCMTVTDETLTEDMETLFDILISQ